MSKKGLFGKILLIVGIVFLIIVTVIGITVYQVFGLVSILKDNSQMLQNDFTALAQGDCSKLPVVKTELQLINSKVLGACKNPLISYGISKMPQVPFTCSDMKKMYSMLQGNYSTIEETCNDLPLVSEPSENLTE